jgi:hypothetical protein
VRQLWAYAYRVAPPPSPDGLRALRRVVDVENASAFEQGRAWAAQLILEQRSAQILVVADSPTQNRLVNRRLETELQRLAAPYRLTDPLAIHAAPQAAGPVPQPV